MAALAPWIAWAGASTLALLALFATPAWGQPTEREVLAEERRRIEADYAAEEAACAHRFAVNACVEDVAERRRAALAPLRERELALDEAERRARAAARQREAQARQRAREQAAAARGPTASTPVRGASAAAPSASSPRRAAPEVREPARAGSEPDSGTAARAARDAAAAERAAAAQRRQEQARETQLRIERREAERARSGKTAQPLPVPASAGSN